MTSQGRKRLLDNDARSFIRELLRMSSLYLDEVQKELMRVHGVAASLATICRVEKSLSLTRKFLSLVPIERNEAERAAFNGYINYTYTPHEICWIDETGKNDSSYLRRLGKAPKESRATSMNVT